MNSLTEAMIIFGGVYNLGFAIYHIMFWRIFRWKEDLASLRRVNRAVMQILNLCLTFVFLAMAYVSFFHRAELIQTSLGNTILVAISLFWFLRMVEQPVFFGFKKKMSVVLTLIFLLGGVVYLVPALQAWRFA
jgi:hypothetical protein